MSRLRGNISRHLAALSHSPFVTATPRHERWLEYGRLAALPLAILPIPPDSPLASSPTGRARLESPARGDSFWLVVIQKAPRATGRLCKPLSFNYSMMLWTTPEATVRPPSRIAKRRPSSMAIGVIRVISISMLSPGITISTPSGSLMVPVTSVVLK